MGRLIETLQYVQLYNQMRVLQKIFSVWWLNLSVCLERTYLQIQKSNSKQLFSVKKIGIFSFLICLKPKKSKIVSKKIIIFELSTVMLHHSELDRKKSSNLYNTRHLGRFAPIFFFNFWLWLFCEHLLFLMYKKSLRIS